MARPVTLFTGQWADLPLEKLAKKARADKDIIKLNCVNDKLIQIKGNMNLAERLHGNLKTAVARNDDGARNHEFAKLTITYQKVVVLGQEAAKVVGASGLTVALGGGSAGGESTVDLVVEICAVGDDDEGPVPRNLAEDFLGEEDHGEALAAALGVPKDAEAAVPYSNLYFLGPN